MVRAFYDLVFVVTISQLSHYLFRDLIFIKFFRSSCFSLYLFGGHGIGTAFFATRFYSDDLGHQDFLLLLQMGGAVVLWLSIFQVHLVIHFSGFALSYAFIRLILVIEYVRVFRNITRIIFRVSIMLIH